MKPALLGVALAALSLTASPLLVRADDGTNLTPESSSRSGTVLEGLVRRVDSAHDRLVIYGDDNQRYTVDDYNADIRLRHADHAGDTADLRRGMRVRITGTLLGRAFLEADQVRVLPPTDLADVPTPSDVPIPQTVSLPAVVSLPTTPVPATPNPPGHDVSLDGVITKVDADGGRLSLLGPDDRRLTADTHGTDIILQGTERAGLTADLARGMHVHLLGVQTDDGLIQADRIRVLPDGPEAAPSIAAALPVDIGLDQYTGILIDARQLHAIQRSPAPTIIGPDAALLYPDRSHVPTPDEVQDESIVRYYRTLDAAESGVAGAHPLILTAVAVVGSDDGLRLTPEDTALFLALDKRLHFTRTWKVGFLIPADR